MLKEASARSDDACSPGRPFVVRPGQVPDTWSDGGDLLAVSVVEDLVDHDLGGFLGLAGGV